jgi:hypothetical protein
VACENDRYGFHFQIAATPDFDPLLKLRQSDGSAARQDVRTIPFLRFEDNESHGEGLFDFRFGNEEPGAVHGDLEHPFIVRKLRAWESHYVLRPNVGFFLLEDLRVANAAYGIYHPNYDHHVYRDVWLENISSEPLDGGHDESAFPYGNFTYDRLTLANCRLERHPLVQLTAIGARPDVTGHFRGLSSSGSQSQKGVIGFGGGPRTRRTDNPVAYYFHDVPVPNAVAGVVSARLTEASRDTERPVVDGWTGTDARAHKVTNVAFPELLSPKDDLPPATLITRLQRMRDRLRLTGVTHDNGETNTIHVNGHPATVVSRSAGVVDWTITLDEPADKQFVAQAEDLAGNREQTPHRMDLPTY